MKSNLLYQYNNAFNSIKQEPHSKISAPLFLIGICMFIYCLFTPKISNWLRCIFLILITCSTISDGLFLDNYITYIDRTLAIFVIIFSIYKIIKKGIFVILLLFLIPLTCLGKARYGKNYKESEMYHILWHIFVFGIWIYLIEIDLYK